mmetsp:Transcript_7326/g.21591  ORF Transcript_7326/g.21591 Transcript_7326/m.21591 type:complete len:272 (+) Transcript_7326:3591-4406(+)
MLEEAATCAVLVSSREAVMKLMHSLSTSPASETALGNSRSMPSCRAACHSQSSAAAPPTPSAAATSSPAASAEVVPGDAWNSERSWTLTSDRCTSATSSGPHPSAFSRSGCASVCGSSLVTSTSRGSAASAAAALPLSTARPSAPSRGPPSLFTTAKAAGARSSGAAKDAARCGGRRATASPQRGNTPWSAGIPPPVPTVWQCPRSTACISARVWLIRSLLCTACDITGAPWKLPEPWDVPDAGSTSSGSAAAVSRPVSTTRGRQLSTRLP